jgi:hypothetical protein
MGLHSIYQPAPNVLFVVENTRIKLFDPTTGTTHILGYPEAAAWDMATRGYGMKQIVDTLRHITGEPTAVTEQIVVDLFTLLLDRGFVTRGLDE